MNFASRYPHAVFQVCFRPDVLQPFLIRLQIGKAQEVFSADRIKEFGVFVVVKKNLKIFVAADAVVITAFGTNKKCFPQGVDGAYIITLRAFGKPFFNKNGVFYWNWK